MKLIRKLFITSTVCLLVWGIYFVYNRLTDGFNLHQIESSLPAYPQFDIATPEAEEKEKIEKILDQPFHYIGKGCQFYVFESQDGETVIKLLKQKHLRPFLWLKKIPATKSMALAFEDKIKRREERVENLFSSCKLAYEELQEETGLIFIHLHKKHLFGKQVVLIDKLGLKHRIEIDDYEFVLQKKAVTVQKVFEQLNPEQVQEKVWMLVDLVLSRYQKGICDRDRSFVQNVAFTLDQKSAVFVDIGQFYKDPAIFTEEAQKRDLEKRLYNLFDWTQRKFPSLSESVEMAINQITAN